MSGTSHAWLLIIGKQLQIAVSNAEMVEYLLRPELKTLPDTPPYRAQLLSWRHDDITVLDLSVLPGQLAVRSIEHVGVLAYQATPGAPLSHVGLALVREPVRIRVADSQFCEPSSIWTGPLRPLLKSCFSHDDNEIAIIDIALLCSSSFWQQLEQHQ